MDLQITLESILNTLQSLDIKSTKENMGKLLGCVQAIEDIIHQLNEPAEQSEDPKIDVEEMTVGGN